MKLSELVAFRNQLKRENLELVKRTNLVQLEQIVYAVETSKANHSVDKIRKSYESVVSAHDRFKTDLDQLVQDLNNEIQVQEKSLYELSWNLYQEEFTFGENYDAPKYVFERKINLSEELAVIFSSRLALSSDWRFPGLIIRPGKEPWIHKLVNLDPLYLVDTRQDLLDPSMNAFNDHYRGRLRPYLISEQGEKSILRQLPKHQFGLIFAYNFFNFKPLPVIFQYLEEFFELMRPGGKCIFTFNDCDHEHGVINAENKYARYTPGTEVYNYAIKIGFEKHWINQDLGTFTWLELKKPGEISSLRGGQTLAKIIAMP